ncbi:PREDICTED: kelch-like protein 3 [Branchiostoma belcheri]|uniref:Kelch-like protein 3 n=1 Tax=Branchiostoma belcheri TaxID=7741 RepID=A0A6P4Z1M5_BRABE|nr:PREDICTED: kelch-like protein 3 [Branchiostoma belcheri]
MAASEQVHHTLTDPAFGGDMLSVLNDLRAEGVLLDVTVVAGEEEFRAHSTVLAYGSDYFRGLFASGMKESQEKRVDLKDPSLTAEAFGLLLEFLYTGQLVVSSLSVYEVLAVANHLQVQSVLRLCSDFIVQNLRDPHFDMAKYTRGIQVADLYNMKNLQESLDAVVAEEFMELTSSEGFLRSATKDELIKLLLFENLVVPSEQQVYEAAIRWLTHDAGRMEHAAAVLSHVQLALLDVDVLYGQLETDFGATPEGRNLLLEAMAYHGLSPETRRGLNWPRSKPRAQNNVKTSLALSSTAQIFTAEGWKQSGDVSLGGQDPNTTVIAAAVVGNVLYMLFSSSPHFKSFDPTTNSVNTLATPDGCVLRDAQAVSVPGIGQVSNMISPVRYWSGEAKMVAVGARLFLVSSNQKKAWSFDIAAGRWSKIRPVAVNGDGVALVSCQGVVLAVGGNRRPAGQMQAPVVQSGGFSFGGTPVAGPGKVTGTPTSKVQTFFPAKNSWETVSSTNQPHAGATAMVQGDTIYIGGGVTVVNGEKVTNTIVEMCRVFVMDGVAVSAWSVVPQPVCVHKFASQVAVIDRKAYFIVGGQMHFTGKLVDHDRTSEVDVEEMCQAFRKGLPLGSVVCATLSLKEKK